MVAKSNILSCKRENDSGIQQWENVVDLGDSMFPMWETAFLGGECMHSTVRIPDLRILGGKKGRMSGRMYAFILQYPGTTGPVSQYMLHW